MSAIVSSWDRKKLPGSRMDQAEMIKNVQPKTFFPVPPSFSASSIVVVSFTAHIVESESSSTKLFLQLYSGLVMGVVVGLWATGMTWTNVTGTRVEKFGTPFCGGKLFNRYS